MLGMFTGWSMPWICKTLVISVSILTNLTCLDLRRQKLSSKLNGTWPKEGQLSLGCLALCLCTVKVLPFAGSQSQFVHMGLSENVGYIPNYSHLIGIMISKTIGFRGTPISMIWALTMFAFNLSWAEDKDGIAPIAEVVEGILTRIRILSCYIISIVKRWPLWLNALGKQRIVRYSESSHENLGEVERSNRPKDQLQATGGLFFSVAASLLCQAWKQSTKFLGSAIVCQVLLQLSLFWGPIFKKVDHWYGPGLPRLVHISFVYTAFERHTVIKHVQSLQAKLKVVKVEVATKNALQGICRIWKIPWRPADQEEREHVTRSQRC